MKKECLLKISVLNHYLMDLNHDSHYWRIICSQLHLDELFTPRLIKSGEDKAIGYEAMIDVLVITLRLKNYFGW